MEGYICSFMKRLYLSLLLIGSIIILLLGGCYYVPKNSFEISGTVTNNPENLSIIYLEYTVNDNTVLHSAIISKDGTFSFSGTLPSEEPVRALFAKERVGRWSDRISFFFIEPGTTSVLFDLDEMIT